MRYHMIILGLSIICLTAAASRAEVVVGRWDKIELTKPGTAVVVNIQGGERLECTLDKIGEEDILFYELNGKERRFPKSAILKIETSAVVHDRLRNGILIGTLIGTAGGITAVVAHINHETNGPVHWGEEAGAYVIGGALVGAGIGAATGAIVDASIKHREVLYRAK
jgi:hypothetical protein